MVSLYKEIVFKITSVQLEGDNPHLRGFLMNPKEFDNELNKISEAIESPSKSVPATPVSLESVTAKRKKKEKKADGEGIMALSQFQQSLMIHSTPIPGVTADLLKGKKRKAGKEDEVWQSEIQDLVKLAHKDLEPPKKRKKKVLKHHKSKEAKQVESSSADSDEAPKSPIKEPSASKELLKINGCVGNSSSVTPKKEKKKEKKLLEDSLKDDIAQLNATRESLFSKLVEIDDDEAPTPKQKKNKKEKEAKKITKEKEAETNKKEKEVEKIIKEKEAEINLKEKKENNKKKAQKESKPKVEEKKKKSKSKPVKKKEAKEPSGEESGENFADLDVTAIAKMLLAKTMKDI
ncbi:DNA ligase 1 [Neocloeon triangulifer]|uniref:DNA ligase 1 n=1 Tax=Neocloeon triangulifer TaxID=2078957 RepID=UPI00286EEFFE|nr:DNA ligase 1 [Neocloeon triangulifer]